MADTIIIPGMYRSGTSFLTERLIEAGVPMWYERPLQTPHGECADLYAWINAEPHLAEPNFDAVPHGYEPSAWFMRRLRWYKAAREEEHGSATWGFKNPLIVRYIHAFHAVWPDARWVFCLRNPFSAMWSQRRRDKVDVPDRQAMLAVVTYIGNFVVMSEQLNMRVFYWNYNADIEEEQAALVRFLGVDVNIVEGFKRASPRRSQGGEDVLIDNSAWSTIALSRVRPRLAEITTGASDPRIAALAEEALHYIDYGLAR